MVAGQQKEAVTPNEKDQIEQAEQVVIQMQMEINSPAMQKDGDAAQRTTVVEKIKALWGTFKDKAKSILKKIFG